MTKKPDSSPFDLASLADADTTDMVVRDPRSQEPVNDLDGKPWKIAFAGPNHPATVKLRNDEMRKTLKRLREKSAGGETEGETRVDDFETEMVEAYARRTVAWGPILYEGQPFPCTYENALALYSGARAILRQVDGFVQEETNFIRGS